MYFLILKKLRALNTNLFNILSNLYFIELHFPINDCYWNPNYDFLKTYIWGNADILIDNMKIPSEKPRGVLGNISEKASISVGGELQKNN